MAEYIERESAMLLPELPKEYRNYQTDNLDDAYEQGWYDALCCLEHIPAADVAPVVHGRWVSVPYKLARVCSVCNRDEPYKFDDIFADIDADVYDYCPNCGARMDEVE